MAKSSSRKNAKRSRSPRKEVRENALRFETVRSAVFSKHQISFLDSVDDSYVNNNPLVSTPQIAFTDPSSSSSTVLIDYSHSKNIEDRKAIISLFKNTNRGTQFTISNGSWQSPIDDDYKTADLSGTYEFISLEGYLIIAKAIDVTSAVSTYKTYDAKYFIDIPQLTKNISFKDQKVSEIQNILGQNSEKSFHKSLGLDNGFVGNNDLWIAVGGSTKNSGKLKIKQYRIDREGKEILVIDNKLVEENFLSSTDGVLELSVYKKEGTKLIQAIPRLPDQDHSNTPNTRTTAMQTSDDDTLEINEHGHAAPEESIDPRDISADHSNSSALVSVGNIASSVNSNYRIGSDINRFTTRVSNLTGRTNQIEETFDISVKNIDGKNKYVIDGSRTKAIILHPGKVYRFFQTHPSNENHPIRISKTQDGTHGNGISLHTGVVSRGTLGRSAVTTFTVGSLNHELYVFCANHPGMGFKLKIDGSVNKTLQGYPPTELTEDEVIGQHHLDWFLWFFMYTTSYPTDAETPTFPTYPQRVPTSYNILGGLIRNQWNQDGLNIILEQWGSGSYPLQSSIPPSYNLSVMLPVNIRDRRNGLPSTPTPAPTPMTPTPTPTPTPMTPTPAPMTPTPAPSTPPPSSPPSGGGYGGY